MTKLSPIHPGAILQADFLEPLGLSQNQLAIELRVPSTRVNDIIHGRRGISAETALRLGRYFGTSAAFWMNLQTRYDLDVADDEKSAEITRDVRPRRLAHAQTT